MSLITRRDILGPSRYAPIRDEYRKRIIQLKKPRRVVLGDRVSLVFENRDTLSFQIEEMLRAEQITDEAGIAQEIEIYNGMMPDEGSLTATLFLEIPRDEGHDVRAELARFIGIDEHVLLHIGAHVCRAEFEPGRQEDDRISAVQYTRFQVPAEARAELARPGTPVAIEISHPNYQVRVELDEASRDSLARDLATR
jgi:hypothetical protein